MDVLTDSLCHVIRLKAISPGKRGRCFGLFITKNQKRIKLAAKMWPNGDAIKRNEPQKKLTAPLQSLFFLSHLDDRTLARIPLRRRKPKLYESYEFYMTLSVIS